MPISFSGVSLSGTTIVYPPTTTFGNNALFPNSSSQFLSIGSPTSNLINWKNTSGFTCEYWFYFTSLGASINGGPGNHDGSITNYWSFGPISTGAVEFYYWAPGTTFIQTSASVVNTNAWNNIALVCTTDGIGTATINIYVNGTRQTTTTASNGVTSLGTPFGLGKYGSGGRLDGYMNNLRVSNINRYSGASYTLATTAFTADANTQLLIQPTESSGTTITYQNSGAGGTMTNASNLVTATTTRADHT
jgi:hypothetical protein